jgi:dGTPase
VDEPHDEYRTDFERDRDRIIHSKAFRRLKHKTQVFLNPEGDHYVTRLTHTVHVTQVGRAMAVALGLNEPLTEAICLAHDVGHSPFGHTGEDALTPYVEGEWLHSAQGVRVLSVLEPLNLTWEVLDGVRAHSWKIDPPPATPEGDLCRFADRIAYLTHDVGRRHPGRGHLVRRPPRAGGAALRRHLATVDRLDDRRPWSRRPPRTAGS